MLFNAHANITTFTPSTTHKSQCAQHSQPAFKCIPSGIPMYFLCLVSPQATRRCAAAAAAAAAAAHLASLRGTLAWGTAQRRERGVGPPFFFILHPPSPNNFFATLSEFCNVFYRPRRTVIRSMCSCVVYESKKWLGTLRVHSKMRNKKSNFSLNHP